MEAHGGALVQLVLDEAQAARLKAESRDWPSWDLTGRQSCDLELLLNGGFSPLRGFLTRADYESVCDTMRLVDGTLWPMPVTLDVDDETAGKLSSGSKLALRDDEGVMLALLHVEDVWQPDLDAEAKRVYGTNSVEHPAVAHLQQGSHTHYVGGRLEGLQLPLHHDFRNLRPTPRELRDSFARLGWSRIVSYQSPAPMHRAEHALTLRAIRELDANLLIHPLVGTTRPGDAGHYTRVHCYKKIVSQYPANTVELALLPLAVRLGGPRETLWQAIVGKNHGCTHLLVGRDHAAVADFNVESQELLARHEKEIGVAMIPTEPMVYVEGEGDYVPADSVSQGACVLSLSEDDLRQRLAEGGELPEWFTFPEIAAQLRRRHPPRREQGFTVFFTGFSGSGKSTVANALLVKILELGGRRAVTLLDGDVVRKNLSSELDFSREHRNINIRRIGYVASEITKNGGIAVCAPIAPYDSVRKEVRGMIEALGGFILVHVDTPIEVCEKRDRKGLYAKARAGIIKEFTGITDPYETPADADVSLLTTELSPEQAAEEVLLHLKREGYVEIEED